MAVNSFERYYLTNYYEPYTGLLYGVTLRASGEEHLRDIEERYDLDFTAPDGESNNTSQHRLFTWAKKSEKHFTEQLPAVLHHACFVGFLASRLKRGAPNAGVLLSDSRGIHTIAHRLQFGFDVEANRYDYSITRDAIVTDIAQVELLMPWLWPPEELGE